MLVKGSHMSTPIQEECKRIFIHRFTGDHMPEWPSGNYKKYPHFTDDKEWLENTFFHVTINGTLDKRYNHCESHPTFPLGRVS